MNTPQRGMKPKTIKSILRKKVNAWLETIDDEELRKKCKKDVIVTGGCIASMLLGEKVNDFDVYFRTYETTLAVANYYTRQFNKARSERGGIPLPIKVDETSDVHGKHRIRIVVQSAGVESEEGERSYHYFESRSDDEATDYVTEVYDDPGEIQDVLEETEQQVQEVENKPPYRPVFLTTNAITLSGKIQIILRFYGESEEIHENYDFVHCTNYWCSNTGQLDLRPEALRSLLSRTLVYNGSRYPICSLFRIRKFIDRGWRINAGQILKIAMQVTNLDLTDMRVLEDQLTGVDVAYFNQVLDRLKDKDPQKVDSAYLIEILNRMFGDE